MVASSSAERRNSCITACIERVKTTVYQEGRSTVSEETRRAVLIDTVANGGFNPGRCLAVLQDQGLLAQYRRRLAFEIDDQQFRAQRDANLEQEGYKAGYLRQHLSKVTRGQPFVRAREARTMESNIDSRIEMEPIISMEDIYIALVSARGNQVEDAAFSDMSISLKTPPSSELRERYMSLNGKDNIDAADIDAADRLSYAWDAHQTRTLQRESEAGALIASVADPAKIRRYLRGGAPSQSRLELWALALDSAVQPGELDDLLHGVIAQERITDDIIRDDVAERTADGNYFPFEDLIESLSLTLSRDPWVGTNARAAPHQPMTLDDEETSEAVPPSSHVPFEGWACLACPFAYLAESINSTLYGVYRAFYCRYWVRLVSLEMNIDSLPYLAGLCENLVFDVAPELVAHLQSIENSPSVLKIAFPWILCGFVGYIRPIQLLLLYDRMIAYDRLELIAILAAGIIIYRREALMVAETMDEVRDVFSNLDCIQ
ncbi:hypothetical protein FOZ63_025483, partial [Perkinsus olseni]